MDPLRPHADEIERILRQAHVHQMRGERSRADELVKQALALDPENATVWELNGDLLMELGHYEEAKDAFAKAVELDPKLVTAEKKVARAIFMTHERSFQRTQMEAMVLNPGAASNVIAPRKPALAMLLSALIPGAGQLYNGQFHKGWIVLGVYAALVTFVLASPGFSGSSKGILSLIAGKGGAGIDFWVSVALFLGFVLWAYAVGDAAVNASKLGQQMVGPRRPQNPFADYDSEPR